jgi:hypothetical protein
MIWENDRAHEIASARRQGKEQSDAEWQGVVAEKDAALAEKDAENARLLKQLAQLQAMQSGNK